MRLLAIVLVSIVLLAGGCGGPDIGERSGAAIEFAAPLACPTATPEPISAFRAIFSTSWIDFVKLSGITYVNQNPRHPSLTEALIGERLAVVCRSYQSDDHPPHEPSLDGDAAYLTEGTEIFSMRGYSPRFRILARRDGQLVLFEARTIPGATHGRNLIDLSQVAVRSVVVNSAEDGTTELARITDPKLVKRMVELLHDAPVNQTFKEHSESRYFVEFELDDGTSVNRSFWLDDGEYSRGVMLPEEFIELVSTAVGPGLVPTASTGTTAPAPDGEPARSPSG